MDVTLAAVAENLQNVEQALQAQREAQPRRAGRPPRRDTIQHCVADKGYHSAPVCERLQEQGIEPVISEPKGGRRKWKGKRRQQAAFYRNCANIRSEQGKQWMRQRAERVERAFAHYLDDGGMRRLWLKGHENILKRLLIQVAGFNLGLVMRKLFGAATPRAMAARLGACILAIWGLIRHLIAFARRFTRTCAIFVFDRPDPDSTQGLLPAA